MKAQHLIGFGLAALLAAPVLAQDYPTQPITFYVAAAPGGPIDILGRMVADGLTDLLPQPVVVENRPGQGGQLAAMLTSTMAGDGYSFLVTSGGIAALPVTGQEFTLDPSSDFTPVALMASAPRILLANAEAPFDTFPELIAYATENPGMVNFGDMGGTNTLDMAMIAARSGLSVASIPYAGSASEVETALAAGEIQIALDTFSSARNFLEQGRTKALAVGSATPLARLPEVPTLGETVEGLTTSAAWYAVMAPAGVPAEIVTLLNGHINAILSEPENQAVIDGFGLDADLGDAAHLATRVANDVAFWQEAAAALNP